MTGWKEGFGERFKGLMVERLKGWTYSQVVSLDFYRGDGENAEGRSVFPN
jgi:hypothetical protein